MIYDKVVSIIADSKGVDKATITAETLLSELGFDSLDAVQLVMDLEEEFGITIGTDKMAKTVGEAVAIVEEKMAGK